MMSPLQKRLYLLVIFLENLGSSMLPALELVTRQASRLLVIRILGSRAGFPPMALAYPLQ